MKTTAAEIDQKLREDFRRTLKEYGTEGHVSDPILSVLFRTFATRIQAIYSETEHIRSSLLDELIDGLGFTRRFARPAQTVISYRLPSDMELDIAVGTELRGSGDDSSLLTFAADYDLRISGARLGMVLAYQDGSVRLLRDMDLPESVVSGGPRFDPVACRLGPYPSLFLAVEGLSPGHLSNHGFYFHLDPEAVRLHRALPREHWCMATSDGTFGGKGLLRPFELNGGQVALQWLGKAAALDQIENDHRQALHLPFGYWAGRCFRMPQIPEPHRFICSTPRILDKVIESLFERPAIITTVPRVWLRVQFASDIDLLAASVRAVHLNCQSASNVECLNQTVRFASSGQTIPLSKHHATAQHLVAPLSIVGESGLDYLPELEPSLDLRAGRYRYGHGNITFLPGRRADGQSDQYVNLRTWMTVGDNGNRLRPGSITAFAKPPAVRVVPTNLTAGAGGSEAEQYDSTRSRFALTLAARDRLITAMDISLACRAFDRRILEVHSKACLVREVTGIVRAYRVVVRSDRNSFTDPEWEGKLLTAELRNFLQDRVPLDVKVTLALDWAERGRTDA